ncbi:MAG: SDR family oxidoreductase [Candidatus Thalassarchaeaceae archaeon]|nr:SDR family oxidoreductase [Candidatus Thalassarchaeaceae archaeon]
MGDTPVFAFLLLKEHPYGREMLRQILSEGFVPNIIIEEDSVIGDEEREKFLKRIEGNPIAPTIAEQIAGLNVNHVTVPIHNSEEVMPHIQDLDLDLIVFGGTRIIRGNILDHPKDGVINSHPGLLPECRGSASPAWSVYHDIPIGSSTHFCDNGIDTGELLLRREVPVKRGMTYEDLCYETLVLAGVLMKEALMAYVSGKWSEIRHPQGESPWPTFRNAPPEIIDIVNKKLAEQTYAHYVNEGEEMKIPFASDALKGMRALVCGASKGIGRATAEMMAACGADVIALSRSAPPIAGVRSMAVDLEDQLAIEKTVKGILAAGPIHILINNAAGPPGGPLLDNSIDDFEVPFKRHLHAAHRITQMVVPSMEEVGMGRIVNIISTSVREPIPNIGLSNTLRGAMASWSKSLSRELPECITINNVLPGFTDTDRLGSLAQSIHDRTGKSMEEVQDSWLSQVPIGRLINPQETASAITFLSLPTSGGIRGVSLAVDGGRMRSI